MTNIDDVSKKIRSGIKERMEYISFLSRWRCKTWRTHSYEC